MNFQDEGSMNNKNGLKSKLIFTTMCTVVRFKNIQSFIMQQHVFQGRKPLCEDTEF